MLDTLPVASCRHVHRQTARLTAMPSLKEGSSRENFYHYAAEVDGETVVSNSRDPRTRSGPRFVGERHHGPRPDYGRNNRQAPIHHQHREGPQVRGHGRSEGSVPRQVEALGEVLK